MSFLWKKNVTSFTIKNNKNTRPSPNKNSSNQSFAQNLIPPIKRISLFLLRKVKAFLTMVEKSPTGKWLRASMTLEAAAILPLLFFFFLNISSSIEMMRLHGNLELALWETGSRMAVYGYIIEEQNTVPPEGGTEQNSSILGNLAGIAFSYLYVRNEIIDYLGDEYLEASPLSQGASGLNFLESSFMETEDCIDLLVTYQVSNLFSIPGFSSFRMANRYYGRAWTGYEIPTEEEDNGNADYVYVTETGEVYHETKECSHLKLQIRSVSLAELPYRKNAEGSQYTLCWLCRETEFGGEIYITESGERYHYSRACSGLKRTIFVIERSKAESYRPCSRCAVTKQTDGS